MRLGLHEKGQAGMQIFLSVIVMIFVIGMLVMVFALMGGELQDATDDNDSIEIINDTTQSIKGVTDWFPLFIVISAMVVLILLTVLIIVAIKGSGIMARGGTA